MSKVLLDDSQALELFCRVISAFESVPIRDFKKIERIQEALYKYTVPAECTKVNKAIDGGKIGEDKKETAKHPRAFYELGRRIRFAEPVVLEDAILNMYLGYIDSFVARTADEPYDFGIHNVLVNWSVNFKQHKLEGTRWWLYFYDTKDGRADETDKVHGVTRAILKLDMFSKAEIVGYRTGTGEQENYVGWFDLYGRDGKHLKLQMKLKEYGEKDLHVLLWIGTDKISLAVGQFHNIGRSIYAGTVMIEPITEGILDQDLVPGFFSKGVKGAGQIPDYVWAFFKDRQKNIQRVYCGITSPADFWSWHRAKNPHLYKKGVRRRS